MTKIESVRAPHGVTKVPAGDNQKRYDRIAPLYDAVDMTEALYKARLRPRLLEGLSGQILDMGAGTGRNLPFVQNGAQVVGVDLSPGMLARARWRAGRLNMPVGLAVMDVLNIALPDDSVDAVVSAFMLCCLDEALQKPALTELARVCRPGGEVRILDYAFSRRPFWRAVMEVWQPYQKLVFGAAFDRHTTRYLDPAGLELIREEGFVGDMVRLLTCRVKG